MKFRIMMIIALKSILDTYGWQNRYMPLSYKNIHLKGIEPMNNWNINDKSNIYLFYSDIGVLNSPHRDEIDMHIGCKI